MEYNKFVALCLVALAMGQAASLPQHPVYNPEEHSPQVREERKFAEKPNVMKKVGLDDIDDIGSNSIQEGGVTSFSWSNMLGMLMQMLLGPTAGITSPSKNDIDDGGAPTSPWSNLLAMGLRVITVILGGPQGPDGVDKVDNAQSSPMQFINLVMNLLEALKTSFSHRSFNARSLGKRDSVSEAGVASIIMLKGYMRSMKAYSNGGKNEDDEQRGCAERIICEASAECAADSPKTSLLFCQLGSYAASWYLQGQGGVHLEALYDAARRGRSGENCRTLFVNCNAV
uniref:CTTNBP2_0 protein n=1 Tax=Fopius arisanus TaxID=64838 RepID=A0A0C9RSI1_9HYME